MKITFPHMGNVYIPLKSFFEELHIEAVIPPFNSDTVKNIGCKYAPEYACLPFKLILGNMLEGLEGGADTIIMLGGSGPCRFGYFGHLLKLILRDAGYNFKFICLEPSTLPKDISLLIKAAGCNIRTFLYGLLLAWTKLEVIDAMEQTYQSRFLHARDKNRFKEIFHREIDNITNCGDISMVKKMAGGGINRLKNLSPSLETLPKVLIVGDIYTLNEPYSNQNVEDLLMEHGIETHRSIYTSTWVKDMLLPWRKNTFYRRARTFAGGFLKDSIGGFALDTVYHAAHSAVEGYDGVIHIFPITCMPEIVSCQILRRVSNKKRIPIMSLTIDEHIERIGMETRIEAFAELLYNRNHRAK